MITAPPGIVARAKSVLDGKPWYVTKPVVAFDDEGCPLVVDDREQRNERCLVPASAWTNYAGMAYDPHPPLIALLPDGGWRVEWLPKGGSEPLVGWGLTGSGSVVPLIADEHGWVENLDAVPDDTYRVYHPGAAEPEEADGRPPSR